MEFIYRRNQEQRQLLLHIEYLRTTTHLMAEVRSSVRPDNKVKQMREYSGDPQLDLWEYQGINASHTNTSL